MASVISISELPLFAGLSTAECQQLESRMRQREFAPQQLIVREGGPADAAFLVMDGLVAVRHKDPVSAVEFVLAELGSGEMFGEMALMTGKPRTASVVAVEQTTCAVLERTDFERMLREHPNIALALGRRDRRCPESPQRRDDRTGSHHGRRLQTLHRRSIAVVAARAAAGRA